MAENDWERLGTTGRRANKTARLRDRETARQRDCETTGLRDHETARPRDCKTTRQQDRETTGPRDYETTRPAKNTGILRRSQAFPGVLSCAGFARQLGAADAPLSRQDEFLSEGVRCGAIPKDGWMGVYLAYIPIQTNELGAADAPLSRQGRCAVITSRAWCQKGAECYTRQKCRRWVVLRRTSH